MNEIKSGATMTDRSAEAQMHLKEFPTLDSIVDAFKKNKPDLWKKVFTKHIDPPANYYSMKLPAVVFASAVLTAVNEANDARKTVMSALNICTCAAIAQKYDYPVYYVSKNILTALSQTEPPEDLTWEQLQMPFDSIIFMLPRGFVTDAATGEEINFLGFAKISTGERIQFPYPGCPWGRAENEKITIFWSLGHGCFMQDVTFTATQSLKPAVQFIREANEKHRNISIENDPYPLCPPSEEQSAWLAGMVANMILLLQAEPEMVERGGSTGKRLKSGVMTHKPTFLGFKYSPLTKHKGIKTSAAQIQQEIVDGLRIIKWKRGYWSNVRYGKGWELSRRQWIQPHKYSRLINAKEEEDDAA